MSSGSVGVQEEVAVDFRALAQETWEAYTRDQPEWIAVDTETEGTAYFDRAFCATFAWPSDHGEEGYYQGYVELFDGGAPEVAREILKHHTQVYHNPKFDLQKLIQEGVLVRSELADRVFHDTEAIYHLLDEQSDKGLKDLAISVLNYDDTIMVPYKSGKKKGELHPVSREKHELDAARKKAKKKVSDGYECLPREVVIPYAMKDAWFTAKLFDVLYPQLMNKDDQLKALYAREMRLMLVLLDIESKGVRVDLEYLGETSAELARKIFRTEAQILQITGREEFVNHHDWIKSAFKERNITLADTQAETLMDIDDPLAECIVEFRRLSKLHSTYIQPMLTEQRDGILHPNFRQHGTRTGRMSSGGASE